MNSSIGEHLNLSNILNSPACVPCLACKTIVPDRTCAAGGYINTDYERIDLYPTYPGLQASAETGCLLCGLIRQALRSISSWSASTMDENDVHQFWKQVYLLGMPLPSDWDRLMKLSVSFVFATPVPAHGTANVTTKSSPQLGGMVTSMWVQYGPSGVPLRDINGRNLWESSTLEFTIFDSIDVESLNIETRRKLPSLTALSDPNINMIQQWMSNCQNNHEGCAAPSEPWLPTRLLEIGGTQDSLIIRLIETRDIHHRENHSFTALSHMWGDMSVSPPLRTIRSNYEQLKLEITLTDLPRNFIDAARVTFSLGIRYLWIDSLCIIQDLPSDWSFEAGLMHLVYRHALITIVATSATSSHDGFLTRTVNTIPAIKVAYQQKNQNSGSAEIDNYFVICYYDKPRTRERLHAIDGSKWNTRGWTMQERSLSTRSIHFCENKIFYECRGCMKSEENEPSQEVNSSSSILWPRRTPISSATLRQHWELFLIEYTQRNLTNSNDKLMAIQSVASEMANATEDDYIPFAGIWRQTLHKELLWVARDKDAIQPGRWRAPTWSWASVDGGINPNSQPLRHDTRSLPGSLVSKFTTHPFKVLDVDSNLVDSPSGMRGYLHIKTLTRRIANIKLDHSPDRRRIFFPYNLLCQVDSANDNERYGEGLFAHGRLDVDNGDGAPEVGDDFLYAHVSDSDRASGLILRRLPETSGDDANSKELWRRVGVATLFADKSGDILMDDIFDNDDCAHEIFIV